MEDGGDQSFVDAAQLTVDHTLQDGAEATPFGHNLRVLQGCRGSESSTRMYEWLFIFLYDKLFLFNNMTTS